MATFQLIAMRFLVLLAIAQPWLTLAATQVCWETNPIEPNAQQMYQMFAEDTCGSCTNADAGLLSLPSVEAFLESANSNITMNACYYSEDEVLVYMAAAQFCSDTNDCITTASLSGGQECEATYCPPFNNTSAQSFAINCSATSFPTCQLSCSDAYNSACLASAAASTSNCVLRNVVALASLVIGALVCW